MTTSTLAVLAALAGGAALLLVVTGARHPAARRLGARSAVRRPTETALVIVGALLGTAIITGSLVVGDALRSSLRAGAFTQLGPVDETVTAPGIQALPALRQALAGLEGRPAIDGVAFGVRSSGTVAVRGGEDTAVQPDALLLEIDFDRAGQLGGDPEATGLADASTPQAGEVAISADLATALDVATGDELTVFAYGSSHDFRVGTVLPRVGLAGYTTDLDARSFNVFLPPGAMRQFLAGASAETVASPPVALAFVSNEGGVLEGAERTQHVTDLLDEQLRDVPQANIIASKQQTLDTAEEISSRLTEIFLGIGAFAVVAGVLLLVNVFVMLAQERRSQLGIMRAVGMQRTDVIRAFVLEGSLYAAAAAVLGAVAGIGVGAAIIQVARGISGGPAGLTLELNFTVQPATITGGMLIGLLIALATILVTSIRISRLNIIRAIRELPEPRRRSRRMPRLVVGWLATLGGAAVTTMSANADTAAGLFLGPAILAGGLAALVRPTLGRRLPVTILGILVTVWGVIAPTVMPTAFREGEVIVFVVQGLVITAAAVVVAAHNQGAIGRLVRRAAGGTGNLTARLGLAYPLARPFRTTMTLTMYALIIFTIVLVSLLAQVLGGQTDAFADAESGGYDLLVTSAATNPLPPDTVRQINGVEAVAPLRHARFNVEFRVPGHDEFRRWFASGYDRSFLRRQPPTLDRWLPELDDQQAVWEHVLRNPSTMIVGAQFLQEAGAPQNVQLGDAVEVRDPITGDVAQRQVVGIMKGGLAFSGAFMSEDSITSLLGPQTPTNRLYVAVANGADPQQIGAELEAQNIRHGVEGRTFQEVVAQRQRQNRQFLRILQGYLMLGLLVGTAGLAVVMVRAVRERRQQIGVLRSIGLQPRTVGRSFMLEAAFIAVQGVLIGTALAAATAYQLITNAAAFGGLEVRFVIPWAELAVLLGLTLLASVAAAGWPARRASRIRPAVALRTVE